jgi:16S rRNA (uracil1498-N3)-methyltransferase
VLLEGDEAHHATTVARLRRGDTTLVGDGQGSRATATVEELAPGAVALVVTHSEYQERPAVQLWLAQSLAKGGRDELAIQMATELGVDGIIALEAQRSVVSWRGDKITKGISRWKKIVQEASKQSCRHWIPQVRGLWTINDVVDHATEFDIVVLDPAAKARLSDFHPRGKKPVLLVVGPEGGLSSAEIEVLVGAPAIAVKLGDTVLRASSAGPAALAVWNTKTGRW